MAGWIFGFFCVISVLSAAATGHLSDIGHALFAGTEDAVSLVLSLGGMMCLWSGLLEVLREVGGLSLLERLLSPLLKRLFSDLPSDKDCAENGLSEITASLSANLLGIGNAATPLGLRAMERLKSFRVDPNRMSNAEILFVVINTAPPTFLPTTLLTLRHAAGSLAPTAPLPMIWAVSVLGCLFALILTRSLTVCKRTPTCAKRMTTEAGKR
ncbi:MAG: spore maturation protein A [Clostridia bacterium]|nr:spore maturation protein A [Clostridia bacterium]